MNMRMVLFAAVLGVLACQPALARNAPSAELVAACQADVQRLCRGVQPGDGRIGQCMRAHVRELSPGCLDAVRASRQNR